MPEFLLFDRGVTYDLTRMHDPDFRTRMIWAIKTGVELSVNAAALGNLVSVLREGRAGRVAFYSSLAEMGTTLPPETSAAGLALWTDGRSGRICDFSGPPKERTGLQVYLRPNPYLQSALEYTWHELLHLTVPFTHGQDAGAGIQAVPGTDNDKWYRLMKRIGSELPAQAKDPITGQLVVFQRPFASLGCRCGVV